MSAPASSEVRSRAGEDDKEPLADGRPPRSPIGFILGVSALVALASTVVLGLGLPPTREQGPYARLIAIHPPLAWAAYLAFGVTALASILYLWPRTRGRVWDRVAAASAEVGVVFSALTLVTGSIWGRPTWGVWWTWDARLTSTALLLALFLGYVALRGVHADLHTRARRSAVAALVAVADVPIVHFSVDWWRTLHQPATIFDERRLLDPKIGGTMLWTLLLAVVAFTLLYVWLLIHRVRLARHEEVAEDRELADALAELRADGTAVVPNDGDNLTPAGHGTRSTR